RELGLQPLARGRRRNPLRRRAVVGTAGILGKRAKCPGGYTAPSHEVVMSSYTTVIFSVAADASPAFTLGPSHLLTHAFFRSKRRCWLLSLSVSTMLMFWRAVLTAPFSNVSLIQSVNALLLSRPRVIVTSPPLRAPGSLRMMYCPVGVTWLTSMASSSTV